MKSIIAAGFLLGMAHGAAIAGPYANVEVNSGFVGSDYGGSATDVHVGYEGSNWYVQGGPVLLAPDDGDGDVELSGKAGISGGPIYTEVSFSTGDTETTGNIKVGGRF